VVCENFDQCLESERCSSIVEDDGTSAGLTAPMYKQFCSVWSTVDPHLKWIITKEKLWEVLAILPAPMGKGLNEVPNIKTLSTFQEFVDEIELQQISENHYCFEDAAQAIAKHVLITDLQISDEAVDSFHTELDKAHAQSKEGQQLQKRTQLRKKLANRKPENIVQITKTHLPDIERIHEKVKGKIKSVDPATTKGSIMKKKRKLIV
jgi:hypothetical protein